ncbi:MAG: sulfite exporter TauE/SafE family protein [Betaproteobacteria bacterium]|nr:MAG: sulfite exporter TauE/SafE family protein [Betaproteobacteria bacterium]
MNFITDPWFYALAIPAVLITGISKTGLGAGSGGIAVPMMSQVIAPSAAAGIMLPILCVMDLLGLRAYRGKWSWNVLKPMLAPAVLGIAIGALLFGVLSVASTKLILGAIAVSFSVYQLVPQLRDLKSWIAQWARPWLWCGLSGFTSTLAHAGGPPVTIYLWPKQLDRAQFVATTVVFFTFVNAVKIAPFALLGQLNLTNLATSLVLMPFAPIGVWLGVRLNRWMSEAMFRKIALWLLLALGCRLLFEGLR